MERQKQEAITCQGQKKRIIIIFRIILIFRFELM